LREPDLDLYPYNTLLTLKAQPDPGFEFVRWTNGSTNAIQEFYVFEPVNLAPVFAAVPRYTVTASVLGGVGGTVVRRPDQPDYYRDTLVRLSARPVPGYVFQVWLDGNTENPRTLSVQSNTALFAVFEPGDGTAPAFTSAPPPAITKGSGESLILTATATGSAPLDFQWYHDDEALPGANDARLVLTNLQAGAEGTYRVIVDNGLGSASAETELTIVASARLEPMSIDDHLRFWLNLSGEQGLVFQVDRSADLANWLPLTTLTNATGNTLFSHTVEDWPFQHFYRADPVTAP
jgi:hypothetical protein